MIFYVISENKENTKTEFTEVWSLWWTKKDFVFCLNQGGLDTKFDVLKMKAHSKNAVGCIPFLPWRLKVEIKNLYEIVDHALVLPPFFLPNS